MVEATNTIELLHQEIARLQETIKLLQQLMARERMERHDTTELLEHYHNQATQLQHTSDPQGVEGLRQLSTELPDQLLDTHSPTEAVSDEITRLLQRLREKESEIKRLLGLLSSRRAVIRNALSLWPRWDLALFAREEAMALESWTSRGNEAHPLQPFGAMWLSRRELVHAGFCFLLSVSVSLLLLLLM